MSRYLCHQISNTKMWVITCRFTKLYIYCDRYHSFFTRVQNQNKAEKNRPKRASKQTNKNRKHQGEILTEELNK